MGGDKREGGYLMALSGALSLLRDIAIIVFVAVYLVQHA